MSLRNYYIILELLSETKKYVGKTFIQKGIYILQNGLDEDLNYTFKLHFYGPFSQELATDIDIMHNLGLITMKYDPEGFGYKISITNKGKNFLEKNTHYKINRNKLKEIISLIGDKTSKEIELVGTVLYFAQQTNNNEEIIKLVKTVKPHFTDYEIKTAIEILRKKEIIK